MAENKPHEDLNATASVFVLIENDIVRYGLIQALQGIAYTAISTGTLTDYCDLHRRTRCAIDLLVIEGFSLHGFLERLSHQGIPEPLRVLLVGIGHAPVDTPMLSEPRVCGWLDIDQGNQALHTLLSKAVTCRSEPNHRCQSCAIKRVTQTPEQILSPKELAVFALLGEGLGPDEVARTLGLSVKTVETHRAHIKQKLALRSGQELVVAATVWRLGLFEKTHRLKGNIRGFSAIDEVTDNSAPRR